MSVETYDSEMSNGFITEDNIHKSNHMRENTDKMILEDNPIRIKAMKFLSFKSNVVNTYNDALDYLMEDEDDDKNGYRNSENTSNLYVDDNLEIISDDLDVDTVNKKIRDRNLSSLNSVKEEGDFESFFLDLENEDPVTEDSYILPEIHNKPIEDDQSNQRKRRIESKGMKERKPRQNKKKKNQEDQNEKLDLNRYGELFNASSDFNLGRNIRNGIDMNTNGNKMLPSKDLFTKEIIPLEKQSEDLTNAFFHFKDVENTSTNPMNTIEKIREELEMRNIERNSDNIDINPMTTVRKVKEVLERRKIERNSDFTYLSDIPHVFSKDTNTEHRNAFKYPFIMDKIQLKPEDCFETNRLSHKDFARDKIEVVNRSYDEDYYREPVGSERYCVMKDKCIATKIPCPGKKKMILREWFLPSYYEEIKKTQCWPSNISECILCMLTQTAKFYFKTKASHMGIKANAQIPLFMHKVGIEGEYRIEDCIGTTEKKFLGLWGPVLLVKLNNLEYKTFEIPNEREEGEIIEVRGFKLKVDYPTPENTNFFG